MFAMSGYRQRLRWMQRQLFDTAMKNVRKNNHMYLDQMEITFVIRALQKHYEILEAIGRYGDMERCLELYRKVKKGEKNQ